MGVISRRPFRRSRSAVKSTLMPLFGTVTSATRSLAASLRQSVHDSRSFCSADWHRLIVDHEHDRGDWR
jgi:hypothetical protein